MHRAAISCSLCGGQYFPKSLPHHQKSCAKKRGIVLMPCPHCNTQMPAQDLKWHFQRCEKAPKPKAGAMAIPKISIPPVDARCECPYCGRKFGPDRIEKHSNICVKTSQVKRPVYDSYSHRHIEGLSRPVNLAVKAKTSKSLKKPAKTKKTITAAGHTIKVNAPLSTDSERYAPAVSATPSHPLQRASQKNRTANPIPTASRPNVDFYSAVSYVDDTVSIDTYDSGNVSPESLHNQYSMNSTPNDHNDVMSEVGATDSVINEQATVTGSKYVDRRDAHGQHRTARHEADNGSQYISFAAGDRSADRSADSSYGRHNRQGRGGDTSFEEEYGEGYVPREQKYQVTHKRTRQAPIPTTSSSASSAECKPIQRRTRTSGGNKSYDEPEDRLHRRHTSRHGGRRSESTESQSRHTNNHKREERHRSDIHDRNYESHQHHHQPSQSRRRDQSTDSVESSSTQLREKRAAATHHRIGAGGGALRASTHGRPPRRDERYHAPQYSSKDSNFRHEDSYKPPVRTVREVEDPYRPVRMATDSVVASRGGADRPKQQIPLRNRPTANKAQGGGFNVDWPGGGPAGAPSGGGRIAGRSNAQHGHSTGGDKGFLPTNDTSLNNPLVSDALLAVYAKHYNENMAAR